MNSRANYGRRQLSSAEFANGFEEYYNEQRSKSSNTGSYDSSESEFINFDVFVEILKRKNFVPARLSVDGAYAVFDRTARFRQHRDGSVSDEKLLSEEQVSKRYIIYSLAI